MKIVKGIQMKVDVKSEADFEAYVAGQVSIKDTTRLHSVTFDPKEQKATVVYLTDNNSEEGLVRGQRLVDVYVN